MEVQTHELKSWPEFYYAHDAGAKPFDVRINDRGFKVGDVVVYKLYDPRADRALGASTRRRITYVLALKDVPGFHAPRGFADWVVLGLEDEQPVLTPVTEKLPEAKKS